jgi:hypothetical protein
LSFEFFSLVGILLAAMISALPSAKTNPLLFLWCSATPGDDVSALPSWAD